MADAVLGRGRQGTTVGRSGGGALLRGLRGVAAWWFLGWKQFVRATGETPSYLSGPDLWVRR